MSIRYGILADDLSGANGIGVEFARHRMRTAVVQDAKAITSIADRVDVLIVDTESRYDPGEQSSRKTREAAQALRKLNPQCVVKKIDSLLRGPIGFDLDAIMDVYGFERCVFAAASPRMGRTTIGGYQLVDGSPLTTQMRVADPFGEVESSFVPSVLGRQSVKTIGLIPIEVIARGREAIGELIKTARAQILVADAASQADLNHVVEAAYLAGIRFFAGTYGMGEALYSCGTQEPKTAPLVVIAGSTSEKTRKQLQRLEDDAGIHSVVLRFNRAFFSQPIERFAAATREELAGCEDVVIHTSGSHDEAEQLRGWAQEEGWGPNALSEKIEQLIQYLITPYLPRCAGFVFSGGATANSVFKLLSADGLTLTGQEVLPATPLTYISGGPFHGRPYLTKPGSFGSEDDLVTMIKFMKNLTYQHGIPISREQSSGGQAR